MRRRVLYIFLAGFVTIFTFITTSVALSSPVFAESVECSGKISGTTILGNTNNGRTYFDAHQGSGVSGAAGLAPLKIVGINESGYAPKTIEDAACVAILDAIDDTYELRGYAWNDNLGFISFNGSCGGSCTYGVSIGAEAEGKRALTGHTWNEVLGYMKFDNNVENGNVYADSNGILHGYAWTDAKTWVDFSGIKIELPDKKPVEAVWCKGETEVCVEILPEPETPLPDITKTTPLTDGKDGYRLWVYVEKPFDLTDYDLELNFKWKDTVKINQMAGEAISSNNSNLESPWNEGTGGVIYKPIKLTEKDFTEVNPGVYTSKKTIRSYAPTTNANVSGTPSLIANETFFSQFTTNPIERNDLILEYMKFTLKKDGETVANNENKPIYANQKLGLSLEFKPAVEVDTLYVNDSQEVITAYRNLPVNFTINAKVNTGSAISAKEAKASFYLYYDVAATESGGACGYDEDNKFDFHFLKDFEGTKWDEYAAWSMALEDEPIGTLKNKIIPAIASLSVEETSPCTYAEAPGLRSEISYVVDGTEIRYYSNKLPRMAPDSLANPAAKVHGNIYSQAFAGINSQSGISGPTANVGINAILDAVFENISKELGNISISSLPKSATCTVTGLTDKTISQTGCNRAYSTFTIGNEKIIYFKGSDVHLNLPAGTWEGERVFIIRDGNLYLDSDIYNPDDSNRFSIIVLGDGLETGHMYVDNDVMNIQSTIVLSGSLFSTAVGDDGFSIINNLPDWDNYNVMANALGKQLYIEGSLSSRNTIGGADMDSKDKDFLLLGTGEIIKKPDSGTWSWEERLKAQIYDFNYLRLFRLVVEKGKDETPIDQRCEKPVDADTLLDILNYQKTQEDAYKVCGKKGKIDGPKKCEDDYVCDGINPLKAYAEKEGGNGKNSGPDGDLVPISNDVNAKGVSEDDKNDAVIIKFKPPSKDSFVFKKRGQLGQ